MSVYTKKGKRMIQVFKKIFGFEKKNNNEIKRKTILTVEDNAVDLKFIKSILGKKYHVISAENGEIGLKMIRKFNQIWLPARTINFKSF